MTNLPFSEKTTRQLFREGMRDGTPIALAYLVVSFTLGITAHNAGLDAVQGFAVSFFNLASAGEYAAFTVIAADAPYWEMAAITLVANARYMLMSCVLSQKFSPATPFYHRLGIGFGVTDEIFGISISRQGFLQPAYNYGAMTLAVPVWALGTSLGILAGDILHPSLLSALSVALYGMFIAIVIPPGKENRIVLGLVFISFALSFLASNMPLVSELSGSSRTIILTVLISGAAACFFPLAETIEGEHDHEA